MMAKLSKNERKRLREARKEILVVIRRSRKIDFQYIVVHKEREKICFGSSIERDCLPTHGPAMSAFMRRFISYPEKSPGPGDYRTAKGFIKKFSPLHGYDGLAMKAPRTTVVVKTCAPPVGTHDIEKPRVFKQCPKPFGVGSVWSKKIFLTPPPGCYNLRKRKEIVAETFGTKRTIIPAVKILCSPLNISKCIICEQQPLGDYWHCFVTNQDMCRPCMVKEINLVEEKCNQRMTAQKTKRLTELKGFDRVRYCGFYHEHNGTTAAVRLLTKRELRQKLRGENYLSMFHM